MAKILGLEYPGGPVIGRLAEAGDAASFAYPRIRLPETPFDFSFSGLKTAVLTSVKRLPEDMPVPVEDICASFQEAVADVLVEKALYAAKSHGIKDLVICGGVAANSRLRKKVSEESSAHSIRFFMPSPSLCTDNAAMVGLVGYHQIRSGILLKDDADVYSRLFC